MVGSYYQDPEAMLSHAISVALLVAAAMYESVDRAALFAVVRSEPMLRRASKRIYHHILREMAADHDPKREDFTRLVQEVLQVAKES